MARLVRFTGKAYIADHLYDIGDEALIDDRVPLNQHMQDVTPLPPAVQRLVEAVSREEPAAAVEALANLKAAEKDLAEAEAQHAAAATGEPAAIT